MKKRFVTNPGYHINIYVSKNVTPIVNVIENNSSENCSSIENIEPIICNFTQERLNKYLNSLKGKFIRDYNMDIIHEHYCFKSAKYIHSNGNVSAAKKIVWLGKQSQLIRQMHYLEDKGAYTFPDGKIDLITSQHFCKKDGQSYDPEYLAKSFNQEGPIDDGLKEEMDDFVNPFSE